LFLILANAVDRLNCGCANIRARVVIRQTFEPGYNAIVSDFAKSGGSRLSDFVVLVRQCRSKRID
jgi:hypothetical protein